MTDPAHHTTKGLIRHWSLAPLTPVIAALVTLLAFAFIWNDIRQHEQELFNSRIKKEADSVSDIITFDLNKRVQAVQRLADRWQVRGGTPKKEFYADAGNYIKDDPGYQAIDWVDRDLYVRWIIPLAGNEAAQDLNLGFEERRAQALELAKQKDAPTLSKPIRLVQGGTGLIVYFPLFIEQQFDGFVLAVFRTEEWLDKLIRQHTDRFHQHWFNISVELAGDIIYADNSSPLPPRHNPLRLQRLLMEQPLAIELTPSAAFYQDQQSWTAEIVLAGGVLTALMLAYMLRLYQQASQARNKSLQSLHSLRQEIHQRHQAEQQLERLSQRLNHIIAGTNVGTWEWNVQTGQTVFNQRWADIIGYSLEELGPTTIDTWMTYAHPDDLEASGAALEQHFRGESEFYDIEARMKHKDGHWVWVHDRGRVYSWSKDGEPEWMAGTHQEITQRKEFEAQIRHMATHDPLTDLPTIALAKDRLQMAINMARREQRQVVVMFIDLDGFKAVNDNFGHEVGDSLLTSVADVLRNSVRQMDTVARIGGDEFLVILTNMQQRSDAEAVAGKIIQRVSSLSIIFEDNDPPLTIGASIGLASYPQDKRDLKQLIAAADKAMYRIKSRGKNHFCWYTELEQTP